jgi:signal transduction histidine kinase
LIITYKDNDLHAEYIAEIENPFNGIKGKIRGIILSSLFIVVLISLSFVYLLRTLFKQKEIEEMRRDFSHNMAHELKTPLAVAYTANDALINFSAGNDPQKRNEYLNIVKKQLNNLSFMVEKILSLSIEEEPDFSLNITTFCIKPELERVVGLYKRENGKEVLISINVNPENLEVKVDKFHLLNVMGNLIDNAVKYSGNSVKISIEAFLEEEHQRNATKHIVKITLTDNGNGMNSEEQKHIFEKFYRVPTGDIQEVRGYGLGLFYAKEIIEKHGGKITVESKKGEGSKFIIRLKGRN